MQNEKAARVNGYFKKLRYFEDPKQVFLSEEKILNLPSKAHQEEKLSTYLKRYQSFAGLPVTGRINKATLERMDQPRCGFPDISHLELILLSAKTPKWEISNINYGFQNLTNQLTRQIIREAIRTAFDIWTPLIPLHFREIELEDSPHIVIRFTKKSHGDSFPFDGPEGILAHTFPPDSSLGSLAGDIHFDDEEHWGASDAPQTPNEKDLVSVAAHEIGHALGLVHSPVKESLMYAIYEGPHRFLHQDDIDRITKLYDV